MKMSRFISLQSKGWYCSTVIPRLGLKLGDNEYNERKDEEKEESLVAKIKKIRKKRNKESK